MTDADLHALLAKLAWEDGCHRCTAEDIAEPDMAPFMKVKVSVAIEAMRATLLTGRAVATVPPHARNR